jgi:hypothetical protein
LNGGDHPHNADHIEGAIRLLGDERLGLQVEDVWFNGWKHLNPPPGDLLGPVQGEFLSALISKHRLPWNVAFDSNAVFVPKGKLPVIAPWRAADHAALPNARRLPCAQSLAADGEAERVGPRRSEAALKRLGTRKALLPADALGDQRPNVQQLASKPYNPIKALPMAAALPSWPV